MRYNLVRIDPEAANPRYPIGERSTVGDPLEDQVHRSIFLGKLEEVLNGAVNWGRKNSLWPYNFGLSCCYVEMTTAFTAPPDTTPPGTVSSVANERAVPQSRPSASKAANERSGPSSGR